MLHQVPKKWTQNSHQQLVIAPQNVGQNENCIVPQSLLTCIANKFMRSNEINMIYRIMQRSSFFLVVTLEIKGDFFDMLWNNRAFKNSIYIKKVVCLFCLPLVRDAPTWFHNVWTYDEVIEYWISLSLKTYFKLKIIEEFVHSLGIVGKLSISRI